MSSVLGVSVGAGTVRLARPQLGGTQGNDAPYSFEVQSISMPEQQADEAAADVIAGALAAAPEIAATTITFRSEPQARAIRAAMARRQLTNYQLVPEAVAAVHFAHATSDMREVSTLAVYDLGSSGLTVSVVNARTSDVYQCERISDISGDYLDSLIREQQIASGRIAHPADPAGLAALDGLCRAAKEQLSNSNAVALPSEQGLVLLTQENFEALMMLAIESSARMARDVIIRAQHPVQAILVVGGGARIPLIARVLERTIGVPVIVPAEPEAALARGAVLLARPAQVQQAPAAAPLGAPLGEEHDSTPAWLTAPTRRRSPLSALAHRANSRRELNAAVLTVSSLVVIAAIGLGLGYGPEVLERGSASEDSQAVPVTTPPRPSVAAPTSAPVTTTEAVHETVAAPPVRQQAEEPADAGPPPPGPNTYTVVPGLPPIVVPTLPPVVLPGFPGPGQ
ncbi:Hsp70 family protein [Nocardia mangyaensis]|uniref:Hsp70 family protein n=1 Tax=Nocardia mangyaensis TaxID=2213200 RepID=UPI002674DF5C|nr:Hsp70 family protein [Nocardia mangyaensis]MDO3649297.1 Hsp70 family protein [Nocardia mangyaensis]